MNGIPHKKFSTLLLGAFLLFLSHSSALAGNYSLDAAHTRIGFSVKHMVISNTRGHFDDFDGMFQYDPTEPSGSRLKINIEAASINTANEKRDEHLRAPDFFDVAQFPQMSFESTEITATETGLNITGELTMHGVTKVITIPCEVTEIVKDPWGKTRFGLSARFTLNRQDYGIQFSKTMETGGLVVADEVKCEIDAEFVLSE